MKITIGIPTRERARYLASCLKCVTTICDPDLEIVVADNASTDDTAALVAGMGDRRIVYVNSGRRVSQRQNFENALRAARGDYVILIGDDDAVLPGQWARLRAILEEHQPDALSWQSLFYQWPALHKRAGGGMLKIRRAYSHGDPFWRESDEHLAAIRRLDRGREDPSPKLYHGLLSRRVIDRLGERTGDVVMSGQVDAYISAAAPAVMGRYLFVRHPFSILGMGPGSGGSSVLAQFGAAASDTVARVTQEAAEDPVERGMAGPFPTLGFYLLMGILQAERHVHRGALAIDYEAYFAMILDQMVDIPLDAREYGNAVLKRVAAEFGAGPALERARGVAGRTAGKPRLRRRIDVPFLMPLTRRVESLSYVTSGSVILDLKRAGMAEIDGAAKIADAVLGQESEAHLGERRAEIWRETRARGLRLCGDLYFRPSRLFAP